MSNYSEQETQVRTNLCKPIVEAAFSIKGRVLSPEDLERHAKHWAASFGRIATPHLRDLYQIGLEKKAKTAEEFEMFWDIKIASEHAAEERRKTIAGRNEPQHGSAIPADILERWTKGAAKPAH